MPTIAQLEKLLTTDPDDPFVLYALAQEFAKAGDVAKAVEHYDRCLEADPHYCYAYYHKGAVLAEHERADEAIGVLRAGLEVSLRAGDAKAHGEIGTLLDTLT